MPNYVHDENIAHFKKLIAESRLNLSRDEGRHKMLLTLLAEEEAKDKKADRRLIACSPEPALDEATNHRYRAGELARQRAI